MKLDTIQTSFTTGEIAPALFGRTDIAQYPTACAELQNFLVRPYGPIISTPGSEYINECKTGGSTGNARVIEFIFSRTDSYVIEMGVGYFRFYTNGAVVTSPGTTPYEVAHTYTESEINDIKLCQLNDIIYIAHPSHSTQRLIRYGATSWSLSTLAFVGGPFMDDNVDTSITLTASATAGTVNITVSPTNSNLFVASASTLGHHNSYWKIGLPITNSTTGLSEQGYVKITNVVNSYTATATVIKTLASTAATSNWAEGAWSDVRGYPAAVTFHQQRLFLAGTPAEPQKVWGSKSFVYDDFAVETGADDDAINIEVASNESNAIKWLAPGSALVAGTFGGDFVISAGDGGVLTPSNTNVKKETSWGSAPITPKKIGNFFYYVQRFRKKLREFFYYWDLDSYKSVDKTILAPHIAGTGSTEGFIDFTYQQNPDTVLWGVTSQGTISTMTREVDQEVTGWARQTTLGTYTSIASIPSRTADHDEVWVVVKRSVNGSQKQYIERFQSQLIPTRQDQCWYVHSGLRYDAYNAYTTTTISLSATSGTNVVVTSSAAHFASNDVGQRIRAIDANGATLGELKVTGFTSSTIVVGTVKSNFNTTAYAANRWGVSVSSLSGLDHLEAATVTVLADGGVDKPNKVVSSGAITLAYDYFVVLAGLPYTQRFKSLVQEAASQRGTAQGKLQRINAVSFKVNRSHTGFYTGPDTDNLDKVVFRDPATLMGNPQTLYTGVIPNVLFPGDYEYGSQVVIENSEPLPIELLSLITTLDTQDN